MKFAEIKTGLTLENTHSTTYVEVIEKGENGFTAIEKGNACGVYDIQKTHTYSKFSAESGAWKIK